MSENENAMVPVAEAMPMPMSLPESWGVGTTHGQFISSLREQDAKDRERLLVHLNEDGDKAENWINKEFSLVHATIAPIAWVNAETGEAIQTVKVVLETDKEERIEFRSDGILKSLYLIFRFKGPPPYKPAVRCVLTRQGMKNGHSMYRLMTIEPKKKG